VTKSLEWKVFDEMAQTAWSGYILGRLGFGMEVEKLVLYRVVYCRTSFSDKGWKVTSGMQAV
jgi:hypothetical protein